MARWAPVLAVLVALGGTAEGQVIEEDELVAMVRSAYRSCTGVGWAAKVSTIREFMRQADLRSVRVAKARVRTGFLDGYYYTSTPQEGYFLGVCSASGDLSHASKIRFEDLDPQGADHRREQIARRIGSRRIARFEATKSCQGLSVRYYMYVPEGIAMGDLCEGQEVSLRFLLTGARHFYLDNHLSQRFYGIVERIVPETACILRCPHGHEYAPSDGYRYCPRDGLPLE